jgi:hypothetical protein
VPFQCSSVHFCERSSVRHVTAASTKRAPRHSINYRRRSPLRRGWPALPAEAPIYASRRGHRPTAPLPDEFLHNGGGGIGGVLSQWGTRGSSSRVGRRGSSASGPGAAGSFPKPLPQVSLDEGTRLVGECFPEPLLTVSPATLGAWGCGQHWGPMGVSAHPQVTHGHCPQLSSRSPLFSKGLSYSCYPPLCSRLSDQVLLYIKVSLLLI